MSSSLLMIRSASSVSNCSSVSTKVSVRTTSWATRQPSVLIDAEALPGLVRRHRPPWDDNEWTPCASDTVETLGSFDQRSVGKPSTSFGRPTGRLAPQGIPRLKSGEDVNHPRLPFGTTTFVGFTDSGSVPPWVCLSGSDDAPPHLPPSLFGRWSPMEFIPSLQ